MSSLIRIGVIGDLDLKRPSHKATNDALQHCADNLGVNVEIQWLSTESLEEQLQIRNIGNYDGFWCAPGSQCH